MFSSLVVQIVGSTTTHHITRGQMRLVERLLEGYQVAWASLMLACMSEKLDRCWHGLGSFCFGSVLLTFFYNHVISLRPPGVMVEKTGHRVPCML